MIEWTKVQRQRLKELGAPVEQLNCSFNSIPERNCRYQELEQVLVVQAREALLDYRQNLKSPSLVRLERLIAEELTAHGFVAVVTPILLSKGLLAKMTITGDHPLHSQVFWVDDRKCLRPMLAPNLYYLLKDLLRLWEHPVRIFEIGPCFRKDTQGGMHLQEFTMLNLVEMGLPQSECPGRIKELASLVMSAAGLDNYSLETEQSEIYGETIDVVIKDLELGSGAMGPHPLDQKWGIAVPWVGIGFGLERLEMAREGYDSIQKAGRSLAYLNGIRLNI